jgi:RNA polymerase sigma-70 factor (ECF subfamily)
VGDAPGLFRRRASVLSAPGAPGSAATVSAEGLFREYGAFAWRVLRRLGVAERDADDVCQEVFVTVHRRIATFEGRSSPRTWLYGVCVRTASEYRKRAAHRHEVVADHAHEASVDASQESDAALREARAMLDRILEGLDDDQRAVFVLYEIEELPMTEVAIAVGCPLQTAYSRLHAARRDVDAAVHRFRAKEASR